MIAVFALGFFPSKVTALTTTITAITFGLPFLIVTTLWWGGWPFKSLSRAVAGFAQLILLVAVTLVATGIGQAITGRLDIGGIFGVEGAFGIFPYGFVLAAGIFVVTLQLTFVTGKVPFHGLSKVASGFAVIATAWVLGLAQYFLLLNWSGGPGMPPAPPVAGVGPIYALDWPAILLSMVMLQLVFFVLLRGYPFGALRGTWTRFVVVNLFTVGGGFLLHWALRAIGLNNDQISALAGATTAAVILIEILFDGWPFRNAENAKGRIGRIGLAAAVTIGLYVLLATLGALNYPSTAGMPPIELWVAGVSLNLIAATAIVHVAVFDRWPFKVSRDTEPEGVTSSLDASDEPAGTIQTAP
ncbi:MAG: hypothetical protein ACQEXN_15375 [Actinomycetota bacterium]